MGIVAIAFLAVNYFLAFTDPATRNTVSTAFGTIEPLYTESYSKAIAYTDEEERFV